MAPPSAFKPNAGLLLTTDMEAIALLGITSQFTTSPKASLMRTPFW